MSIYNFVGGKSNHAKVMEKRLMVSIFKTKKTVVIMITDQKEVLQ